MAGLECSCSLRPILRICGWQAGCCSCRASLIRFMAGAGERAVHHGYCADDSVEHWRERIRSVLQTGWQCGRLTKPCGSGSAGDDRAQGKTHEAVIEGSRHAHCIDRI